MHASIARFFSRRWAVPQDDVLVTVRPVLGGLESCVVRAHVTRRSAPSNAQNVVVKALRGDQAREGAVYRLLWDRLDAPPAARMLGTQAARGAQLLYLEQVAGASGWPWSDVDQAARVCRALAPVRFPRTRRNRSP